MTRLTRRTILTGGAALTAGLARQHVRMARVNVSSERVIRTIVGLRPFRPSGFVVRGEKLDAKTLIHNYGHGGAGITLSWGTSNLAVEEGVKSGARECAVIGCGVVGLSTARLLQLRGYRPVIYAKAMPPETTSNVAGGLWEPTSLFDHGHTSDAFRRQYQEAARFAFRRYQSMAGEQYGVRWLPLYSLSNDRAYITPPEDSPNFEIEKLYPEGRVLTIKDHPFRVAYAHRRQTMLIEPATYLNALVRDFLTAGGRVLMREFASVREIASLPEELVFNCTGLGAKQLFGDPELTPIRGQLVFLLPQPEVDYCTVGPGSVYMFPRHDGILLGGTFERDVARLEPDAPTTERILRDNGELFGGMRS
jgi:glycine/D-amino acid oxidase-like deaminating enzyme